LILSFLSPYRKPQNIFNVLRGCLQLNHGDRDDDGDVSGGLIFRRFSGSGHGYVYGAPDDL
jgi:hypothetical protein